MDRPRAHAAVDEALKLGGDPANIRAFYAEWAPSYDSDLEGDYVGVQVITDLLLGVLGEPGEGPNRSELVVADVGCGTGRVGALLADAGFAAIDGMDLSPEMIAEAQRLGVFRSLHADVDVNLPPRPSWRAAYDLVVSCGVFTLGHVEPAALLHLVQMTRPGGHVFTSTRTAYYDKTAYPSLNEELVDSGAVTIVECLLDAPYTNDSDAHYWAYRVN